MPGRSPTTITFVTRKSCSLCDEALQTLRLAAKPPLVEITTIDVDSDRDLLKRFGNRVPVVLSPDGRVLAEGRISKRQARRALQKVRSS